MTKLWCYIQGDRDHFRVSISSSSSQCVFDLKEEIYKKQDKFFSCNAARLILTKVDIYLSADVKKDIREGRYQLPNDNCSRLDVSDKISEIWPVQPPEKHLSVFICLSDEDTPHTPVSKARRSLNALSKARVEKYEGLPRMSPSELGHPDQFFPVQEAHSAFYFDRPMNRYHDIPPTLLHPVFGEFLDDCETHNPSSEDILLAYDLAYGMSRRFQDEHHRVKVFCEILGKHKIGMASSKLPNQPTPYRTDGDIQERGFRFVILEAKNEISDGGAEPLLQVMCYYQQSVAGPKTGKRQIAMYPNSRLPCLLLCLIGPFMLFAGAAYTDRPHIQTLSNPLGLCFHRSETRRRSDLARHIGAFRKAIDKLREYYKTLSPPTEQGNDFTGLTYPYPSKFTDLLSKHPVSFTYEKAWMKGTPIFKAKLSNGESVMVKFVQRYSREVHERCAKFGCAPKLHGFEELPGGWFMVVMEFLHSNEYHTPDDDDLTSTKLCNAISELLDKLHQEGFVHGDLRTLNTMVKNGSQSEFRLLDFDWSGKIGDVKYPPNVNVASEMRRPETVRGGKEILAEHDKHMLGVMFPKDTLKIEPVQILRRSPRGASSQRDSPSGSSATRSAR